MNDEEARISRLQEHLSTIRKVAGWTTERLGEEIGVTRQTVSNLERNRTPMTKTQYLALRTVLNHEIVANQNQALAHVIRALVDDPLEDDEDDLGAEKDSRVPVGAVESLSNVTGMYAKAEPPSLAKMSTAVVSGAAVGISALAAVMAAATKGLGRSR
ncbi:MAG: helix-turn-helix transcriptional regulator [Adlercreutzia sp.]|nr:helix-turn-helix transcriptional regulator [Adlercreutzia sp.]